MAASRHRQPPTLGLSGSHNKGLQSSSKAQFSAWTPVNHMPSNEQLYQERRSLIGHWYDMWTHGQRQEFLKFVLERSTTKQQRYAFDLLNPKLPAVRQDFTGVLPRDLTLYIFSFLDARSLCRAACVSWYWNITAEQDVLWRPKCVQFAWYLPYTPGDKEYGAWKRHYVACLNTLDRSAPNKQIALLYSTLGGVPAGQDGRSPTKKSRRDTGALGAERTLNSSQFLPSALARLNRPPWLDPDPKPSDLEKGWKAIKTVGSLSPIKLQGMHYSTFSATSKAFSLASAATKRSGRRSANSSGDDEEETLTPGERDPAQSTLYKLSELIKEQSSRMGTNIHESVALSQTWPIYSGPLTTSGGGPSMTYTDRYVRDMRPLVQRYPSHSHPPVILISSEVPAPELLLEGLVFGVLPLIYDYRTSSISSLVDRLDYLLAGRQARSIGLFMEASDGELHIVEGHSASYSNVESDGDQRYFWESLCSRCIPRHDGGRIDLFATLASNARGMDLLTNLQRYTGFQITACRSLSNKRQFVDSEWTSTGDAVRDTLSPPALYFNMDLLATWTNSCLYLKNSTTAVRTVLESFLRSQHKDLITKTVGKILIEALTLREVRCINVKTSKLLVRAVSSVSKLRVSSKADIVEALSSHFQALQSTGAASGKRRPTTSSASSSPPMESTRIEARMSPVPSRDKMRMKGNQRPLSASSTPEVPRKNSSGSAKEEERSPTQDVTRAITKDFVDFVGSGDADSLGSARSSQVTDSDVEPPPRVSSTVDDISRSPFETMDGEKFRKFSSEQRLSPIGRIAADVTDGPERSGPKMLHLQDPRHDLEQRHRVAQELRQTEKVFYRCLLAIRDNYHLPLKNAVSVGRAIISSTNIELIFTDTEELLRIARRTEACLNAKLNDWTAYQCLGDVFETFTSSLQSYVNFASNYPTTLATIMRCQSESPAFRAFLKNQTGQAETAMMDLFELLLLPAQRIASYIHLLNTFKVVSPPDHPDHRLLDVSIARLERMHHHLCDGKERSTRERRLASLQDTIVGCPVLKEGQRYLLYEETFNQMIHCNHGKPYRGQSTSDGPIYQHFRDVGVFLFTDSVLITTINVHHYPFERASKVTHHYAACFALDSIRLIDMQNSKHLQFTFALATADNQERWTCRAASQDVKLSFIAALRKAVEGYQPLQ